MKLVYPAIFSPWDDGDGYTVEVPDLPGCVTEGATLADAILMKALQMEGVGLVLHSAADEGAQEGTLGGSVSRHNGFSFLN